MLFRFARLMVCLTVSVDAVDISRLLPTRESGHFAVSCRPGYTCRLISLVDISLYKSISQIRQMASGMRVPAARRNAVNVHSLFGGSLLTRKRASRQASFLGCGTNLDYITYGRNQYIRDDTGELYKLCYCSRSDCGQELFQPILVVSCQSSYCCGGIGRCVMTSRPVMLCVWSPARRRNILKQFNIMATCQCGNINY